MASLEENLNALLSDPNAMEQIFSLAGKLGMGSEQPVDPEAPPSSPQEKEAEAPPTAASQPLFDPETLGQMGKLFEIFQTSQQTSQERRRSFGCPASVPAPGTPGKIRPRPQTGRPVSGRPTGLPALE